MSEMQSELVDLVSDLASRHEAGDAAAVWAAVCDLGLAGIGLPEENGGSGGQFVDLMTVVTELAGAGLSTPIVDAAAAAMITGTAPSASEFATLGFVPEGAILADRLTARVPDVRNGRLAQRVVVALAGKDSAVMVDYDASEDVHDHFADLAGQPTSTLNFTSQPCVPVDSRISSSIASLGVLRAAETVGHARAAYDLTRSYVRQREQFGAPLVEVPAVAAALATMAIRLRHGMAAVERAARVLSRNSSDSAALFAASCSYWAVLDMAGDCARRAHQLHGAMGVTSEYALHVHTRHLWAACDTTVPGWMDASSLGSRAARSAERDLWELTAAAGQADSESA